MNILQFADFSAPYAGNFISSLERLEEKLSVENSGVVYLFPKAAENRDWAKRFIAQGKKIFFLSGNAFSDVLLIRRIINKYKISIVHTHFSIFKYDLLIKVARIFSRRTIYLRHMHMIYRNRSRKVLEYIKRKVSNADCEIACGCAVKESLECCGISPVETVTNAVDFDRFDDYEKLDRNDFGVDPETKIIFMFGYDYLVKGVDLAIEALSSLLSQNRKAVLFICLAANEDDVKQKILRQFGEIPDFVRFLPPRSDIAAYYHLADVFLSASRSEGCCYALREAGYCGSILVASDIGAHENVSGTLLFKCGDAADLARKLCDAFDIEIPADQIDSIKREYSLNNWCEKILKIYKQNIDKRKNL